jgi:large subunit ribosomal protein L12
MGKEVNEANVKKVIESTGEKADDAKVKALVSALEGVNIDEVIKQSAMPVAVAAPAATQAEAKHEKKEAPAEDKSKEAEEAVSGLASLFG